MVLMLFTFAYLVSELVRNVNGVLAPSLRRDCALTAFELGLLTAAFLAALAGSQLIVGVLLDRYGPKRVVVAMLAVFMLLVVPRHPHEAREGETSWRDQVDGLLGVLRSRAFRVVAPLSFIAQGVWIAYQGLWAGWCAVPG